MFEPTVTAVHPVTGESIVHTSEVSFDNMACGLSDWLKEWYHTDVHISRDKYDAWINLNAGCNVDVACHLMGTDRPEGILDWAEARTIRATLQVFSIDTPNPSWQNMKVSYHRCPSRYFGDKPRMTMSMQGFLQKILRVEPTQDLLERVHKMAFYTPPMPVAGDFEFRWYRGDSPAAAQVFTNVYTNVPPSDNYSDHYPSVRGSCMRYSTWGFKGATIGKAPFGHPVVAYCTPDIAIAWLEDKQGYTVARTLVNLKTKTLVRFYAVAGLECNYQTHRQNYFKGLVDILKSHLPDYTLDESAGLIDCHMKPYEIEDGAWVSPYLDGDYKIIDLDSMTVVDCRTSKYIRCENHMPPVCGTNGCDVPEYEYTCWDCDEEFNGDPYYYDDHVLCECCYENYYGSCEDCDSTAHQDDLYYIEDLGVYYCEDCLRDTFTCAYCNMRFHNDSEAGTTEHDEHVCTSCAERHYSECHHCDRLYPHGDIAEYGGEYLCPSCYEDAVASDEKEIANEQ